jgi:uncharacterized damage-inducible protein DinB
MPVRVSTPSLRPLSCRCQGPIGTVTTMVIPTVDRTDPPFVAGEREMLDRWLDFQRATLLHKASGLSDAQLGLRPVGPSPLSLRGLIRHLTEVENSWFRPFTGEPHLPRYYDDANPDGDFNDLEGADVMAEVAAFETECARSRAAVDGVDLDAVITSRRGNTISLRWVMVHMIEEYARHNGHADLIRERIDGVTGP